MYNYLQPKFYLSGFFCKEPLFVSINYQEVGKLTENIFFSLSEIQNKTRDVCIPKHLKTYSMKSNKKNLGLLAGGLVIASVSFTSTSFATTAIGSGGQIRSEIVTPNAVQNVLLSSIDFKGGEAKCGEEGKSKGEKGEKGKTGDAKCGEKGKDGEAKCGEKGKSGDAKCGEKGKSGDAKCGEKGKKGEKGKSGDAKCGEK